jgi:hypothetical protein
VEPGVAPPAVADVAAGDASDRHQPQLTRQIAASVRVCSRTAAHLQK